MLKTPYQAKLHKYRVSSKLLVHFQVILNFFVAFVLEVARRDDALYILLICDEIGGIRPFGTKNQIKKNIFCTVY